MQKPPRFTHKEQKDFVSALNYNVNQYFKNKKQSRHANLSMIAKSGFYLMIWFGSYFSLYAQGLSLEFMYFLWAVLGFSLAMVTINIGHDAIHGAYSKHKWINNILAHTFNLNGASAYMWVRMHNQAHHTYTNVDGYDEDIAPIPILRISPKKQLWKIHKYQHIYAFFIYTLTSLSWVLIKDYKKFFQNRVGNYQGHKHPVREYFLLFFYKFLNYSLFLLIPLMFIKLPWIHILAGFLLMHAIGGWLLAIIFMLAHAVEETSFPCPNEEGCLENSWTVHQLCTTANFATDSRVLAFFTGGLNTQIEHHLFPHICSIHYPALSQIVKKTALSYDIPYLELSLASALKSHQNFLWKMGQQEPIEVLT